MNEDEVQRLHSVLADAPAGAALRLGIEGNTPEDIAQRWERWNALADYEAKLVKDARLNRKGKIDRAVFGLAAVGTAYGDIDRIRPSGVLIYQMQEHLQTSAEDISQNSVESHDALERVVADAIDDAKNPDRRSRVPGYDDAAGWWKSEREHYLNPSSAVPTGMDLVAADDAVRLMRKRAVDALQHGQALAQHPRMRAEAERYVKREIAELNVHLETAAKHYQMARVEFRDYRERPETHASLKEMFEANERVAAARAAALIAYSAALHQAAQRTTPFMACVRRTLGERFPHEEATIMKTEAGKLTEASSVEAALRLMPKDPEQWYPEREGMAEKSHEYVIASLDRDRMDWSEMVTRRHVPRTPTLRGQALAMACYDVVSDEQKSISDRWAKLSAIERSGAAHPHGVNSAVAGDYAKQIGIPEMPAVEGPQGDKSASSIVSAQKAMVDKASDPTSVYATAPPSPNLVPDTAFELKK